MRSRESGVDQEQIMLEKLVKETLHWWNSPNKRERLVGNAAIYRALDNAFVKDLAQRKRWIAKIKSEVERRESVERQKQQQIKEAHNQIQIEDARLHQSQHPPDTYFDAESKEDESA